MHLPMVVNQIIFTCHCLSALTGTQHEVHIIVIKASITGDPDGSEENHNEINTTVSIRPYCNSMMIL